ncbi:MAG: hypothetical protein ABIG39_03995 [Candidatus Micrarchaeota archaeon]
MAMYGCSMNSEFFDWLPIMSFMILIALLVISLVYMLSQVFRRPEWSLWAKSELWHTLASILLVGIILSFMGVACLVAENLAGGDPFYIADRYLHQMIWGKMVPAVDNLFELSFRAQKWSVFTIGILSCSYGVCFQPFAGFGTLSYNFETMAALVTPFAASLLFQKLLLQFVKEIAFTIIFPIGFILRVFPLTRDAGAFLIAAAIAFYIVFPLTYVFNNLLMLEVLQDTMLVDWCDTGMVGFGGGISGLGYATCQALNTIGQILPQAVFLPALNLVITISFMQTIAKVLSRDYEEDL